MGDKLNFRKIIGVSFFLLFIYLMFTYSLLNFEITDESTREEFKASFFSSNILSVFLGFEFICFFVYFVIIKPLVVINNLFDFKFPSLKSVLKTIVITSFVILLFLNGLKPFFYSPDPPVIYIISGSTSPEVYLRPTDRTGRGITFGEYNYAHEFIISTDIELTGTNYFNTTKIISNQSHEIYLKYSTLGAFILNQSLQLAGEGLEVLNDIFFHKITFYNITDASATNSDTLIVENFPGNLFFSIVFLDGVNMTYEEAKEVIQGIQIEIQVFPNTITLEQYSVETAMYGISGFLIAGVLMIINLIIFEDVTPESDVKRINDTFNGIFISVLGLEFALELLKQVFLPVVFTNYALPHYYYGLRAGTFMALVNFSVVSINSTITGSIVGIAISLRVDSYIHNNAQRDSPRYRSNLPGKTFPNYIVLYSIVLISIPFLLVMFQPLALFSTSAYNPFTVPVLYLYVNDSGVTPHFLPDFLPLLLETLWMGMLYIFLTLLGVFIFKNSNSKNDKSSKSENFDGIFFILEEK